MKKIFYAILCIIAITQLVPVSVFAEIYVPKDISIGDDVSYDAGAAVNITFTNSEEGIGKMENLEYGVVKTIRKGDIISYEILSTEMKDLSGEQSLTSVPLTIPNTMSGKSTDSYSAYVKFFEKNNPNAKRFIFSKEFKIVANNTPFTKIKHINLLKSNGNRYSLESGPTIYSPEYAVGYPDEPLATSTVVEITFESNQDIALQPDITFRKLRSNSFSQQVRADPITIKKGLTFATIPLPTFNYEPGVYVGEISFGNSALNSSPDLQYIIGGDAVTVGNVSVISKENRDFFNFEIFGRTIDLERNLDTLSTSSSAQDVYTIDTKFLDKEGNLIQTSSESVDFSKESYQKEIQKNTFFKTNIENIEVTVTSVSGKKVFEGVKNVQYTGQPKVDQKISVIVLIICLFLLLVLVSLAKKNFKLALILSTLAVLAVGGLLMQKPVFGQEAGLTEAQIQANTTAYNNTLSKAYTTYKTAPYAQFTRAPKNDTWSSRYTEIFTEGDITQKIFNCGEKVKVNFEYRVNGCYNEATLVDAGFYFDGSYSAGRIFFQDGGGSHTGFTQSLPVQTLERAGSLTAPVVRGVTVQYLRWSNSRRTVFTEQAGMWDYELPTQNNCSLITPTCSCTGTTQICTKAGLPFSNTPNSPSCQLQASCSASVANDVATFNTTVVNADGQVTFRDGDTNAVITNPHQRPIARGATILQKILVTDTSGKSTDLVCSATNNEAPEGLNASCTYALNGNNVTFNTIATGAVGAVTYTDADTGAVISNPITKPIAAGATIVQRTLVTDTSGATSTASCSATNTTGTTCIPGTPGCPNITNTRSPVINNFGPATEVVQKNQSCTYEWSVQDVDTCSLAVNNRDIFSQSANLTGPVNVSAADGKNQRATLTCIAQDLPVNIGTVSASALCNVLPEVTER